MAGTCRSENASDPVTLRHLQRRPPVRRRHTRRGCDPGAGGVEPRVRTARDSPSPITKSTRSRSALVCEGCGTRTFVADSEQHWDEEEVERQTCPCGGETFEVGLGLSIKRDPDQGDWIRWGSLGSRCVACGTLASAVDWKSDLALTDADALRVAPLTVLHEPR